ncbi:hypothetical protein [Streptomyces incarnatus]|uniref:hypothetical protein n=1 Tax=Streptomyces incarnatus TaxID=665007 RepID=UPI001AD832C1|nr:hypothetical protein [Streptomyces incarnatus]
MVEVLPAKASKGRDVSGDVELGRLGGPAEISTARGDNGITEATGGTVVLTTQSGDITVRSL